MNVGVVSETLDMNVQELDRDKEGGSNDDGNKSSDDGHENI